MEVGERIKELRIAKKLTQSELAKLVGLSYIQIGRYETQKSNPSSDILQRLAQTLGTTTDYLMQGDMSDLELLRQFKEVEKLNSEDKHLIKTFLDAFLVKRHIQKLAI